ncbi:MAG: hypothetical protein ABIK93_10175 [candidate division WOR-3 bacterium]
MRCIGGKVSIGKIKQEGGRLHYFSAKDCGGCGHYGGCVSAGEISRYIGLGEMLIQAIMAVIALDLKTMLRGVG